MYEPGQKSLSNELCIVNYAYQGLVSIGDLN